MSEMQRNSECSEMYAAGYDKRKILSGKLQQHGFLEKKNFLELEHILVCSVVVHLPQNVFCRYYISADKHGVVFFGGIEYKVSSAWAFAGNSSKNYSRKIWKLDLSEVFGEPSGGASATTGGQAG